MEIKPKREPVFLERKSKRMFLLVTPTLYNTIKSITTEKNMSMNEFLNKAVIEYIDRMED